MIDAGRKEKVLHQLGRPIEPHGKSSESARRVTRRLHSSRVVGETLRIRAETGRGWVIPRRRKGRWGSRVHRRTTVTPAIVTRWEILQFHRPAINQQLAHLRFIQNTPLGLVREQLMDHRFSGHHDVGAAPPFHSIHATKDPDQHGQPDQWAGQKSERIGRAIVQEEISIHRG